MKYGSATVIPPSFEFTSGRPDLPESSIEKDRKGPKCSNKICKMNNHNQPATTSRSILSFFGVASSRRFIDLWSSAAWSGSPSCQALQQVCVSSLQSLDFSKCPSWGTRYNYIYIFNLWLMTTLGRDLCACDSEPASMPYICIYIYTW